jgi:hypothetical protein
LGPKGFSRGCKSSFFQIDIPKILIIYEAGEPDAVFDFLHTNGLTSRRSAEIDFLAVHADAATGW